MNARFARAISSIVAGRVGLISLTSTNLLLAKRWALLLMANMPLSQGDCLGSEDCREEIAEFAGKGPYYRCSWI